MTGRRRTLVDALVVVWILAWILVGIAAGRAIHRLSEVTDAERQAGVATQRAGDLLTSLGDVPLVGGRLKEGGATVREAGRSVIESADAANARWTTAGTLIGIAIAIIPSVPLLLFYLPGRVAFERDRFRIASALRGGGDGTQELLATRAVTHMPYRQLLAISPDPVEDLRAGRHAALAEAELRRMGISARAPWR